MSKCTLVKFVGPFDDEDTFAQFSENKEGIAIYTSEEAARRRFGREQRFDSVEEVRAAGGAYAAALEAALAAPALATE